MNMLKKVAEILKEDGIINIREITKVLGSQCDKLTENEKIS